MVVLDATILMLFLDPTAKGPTDDEGRLVTKPTERINYLISELDRTGSRIVLPTPALSEALVRLGPKETSNAIATLHRHSVFVVQPFDEMAAIELALMLRQEKKPTEGAETWAKLKFDRQIMAIAKVVQANDVYSDDSGVKKLGERMGIAVKGVADLPLPPEENQRDLFEEPEEEPKLEAQDETTGV